MKAHLLYLTLALSGFPLSFAQSPPAETEANPMSDEVRDAIRKFKASRAGENKPATDEPAVAEPAPDEPAPDEPPPDQPAPDQPTAEESAAAPAEPAPPAEPAAPADPEPPPPSTQDPAVPSDPEPPAPEPSLSVNIEKLQTGRETIDPKSVTLQAPFPAKPLGAIPAGWHLEAPSTAPPFVREVELAPGAVITLNIRPHLLVPDADGATTFSIVEPGFDPTQGYRQAHTVGAVLASSIQQLDADSKKLGDAIDQLQQLVMSLPQPDPRPDSNPENHPKPTRKP
jgi:hypothetical protein